MNVQDHTFFQTVIFCYESQVCNVKYSFHKALRHGLIFYYKLDSFHSIQFILYFQLYHFIVLYPMGVVDELWVSG